MLPDNIKINYDKLKVGPNCGIASCDCIALLLSFKDINDSPNDLTIKKYNLLKALLEIPVKDWENNKKIIKNLLNSYS